MGKTNIIADIMKGGDADEAESCSHCGQDITDDVSKAMKKRGKRKASGTAKEVGNTMEPHKGGKTGSFVDHARPGSLGEKVDRNHATKPHAPPSAFGKSLFPNKEKFSAVQYERVEAVADQIERGETVIHSQRNLHTEPRNTAE